MSYETTLFAHIAPRLTDRIEDVAVEALGHILSNSEAARSALEETVRLGGIEVSSIDRVQTQAIGEEGERPDLVCFDDSEAERVLIEAKFWAGLTPNQPNQYLKRLERKSKGRPAALLFVAPAALLFVAPAARLEMLWPELCKRSKEKEPNFRLTVDSKSVDVRSAILSGGERRLLLTSWATLLDCMARKASANNNTDAVADINQLRGLTDRMDADAFLPWRPEDLGPDFAKRMLGLIRLVDDATNRGITNGFLNTDKLKKVPRYEGYGRFIRLGNVQAWFGIECAGWARHHNTPLWLLFKHDKHDQLKQAGLADRMVDFKWRFFIPIELPTAVDYDAVLDSVVDSLKSIAEKLDSFGASRPVEPEQD